MGVLRIKQERIDLAINNHREYVKECDEARRMLEDIIAWGDADVYNTWLDIGWGPYEYHEFEPGGLCMWTMHGMGYAWGQTSVTPGVTPFNGESSSFNKMHEESTERRRR